MKVDFFFSFRSSYSYLAVHRLKSLSSSLEGVEFEWYPVFPPPGGPEPQITADPRRLAYARPDFARFLEAYGLPPAAPPHSTDTDWMPSHAGFLWAREQGRMQEYADAIFRCRWALSLDPGDDAVLRDVAVEVGLDPDGLLAAAHDEKYHEQVSLGMIHFVRSGFFGVPAFTVGEEKFWGNDRFEWAIREILRQQGRPVPDLRDDPFGAVVKL